MASWVPFECFAEHLAEKVHNLGADTLKIALTNSAPNAATNTVLADITQIANGNGYTTGGATVTVTASAQTGGTYELTASQVVFTATGNMGTFRYIVLYNDTPTSPADPLIAYADHGSGVSLTSTQTYTVRFESLNPGNILTAVTA